MLRYPYTVPALCFLRADNWLRLQCSELYCCQFDTANICMGRRQAVSVIYIYFTYWAGFLKSVRRDAVCSDTDIIPTQGFQHPSLRIKDCTYASYEIHICPVLTSKLIYALPTTCLYLFKPSPALPKYSLHLSTVFHSLILSFVLQAQTVFIFVINACSGWQSCLVFQVPASYIGWRDM